VALGAIAARTGSVIGSVIGSVMDSDVDTETDRSDKSSFRREDFEFDEV
jgi:hypothetical protein